MHGFRRRLIDIADLAWFLVWLPFHVVLVEIPEGTPRRRDQQPENQRAVALAVAAHNARSARPGESGWVVEANAERCYVPVSHPNWVTDASGRRVIYTLDPCRTLYAVWYADGRVVEVVTKQLAWGIRPEPFIARFEAQLAVSAAKTAAPVAAPNGTS